MASADFCPITLRITPPRAMPAQGVPSDSLAPDDGAPERPGLFDQWPDWWS